MPCGTAVSRGTAMSHGNVMSCGMSRLVEMPHLVLHGNNYFHRKLGNLTCKILHVAMCVHV